MELKMLPINRYIFLLPLAFFLPLLVLLLPRTTLSINEVKSQLTTMVERDQYIRSKIDWNNPDETLVFELQKIDHENTASLKKILEVYGWIRISIFGKEADQMAWLLVQHADHDIEFQKDVLSRLESLYPKGETSSKNFAYLYDRVAINDKRPQRYGTQGCIENRRWILHPTEDLENLDTRRKIVGLSPYKDYLCEINHMLNLK
jgi:hypothetical protein